MKCESCQRKTKQIYGYDVQGYKFGLPGFVSVYECPHCGHREYFIRVKVDHLKILKAKFHKENTRMSDELARLRGRIHESEIQAQLRSRMRGRGDEEQLIEFLRTLEKMLKRMLPKN